MQLYDYFRSSASFRVRIALNYKKIAYDKIPIDLRVAAQYAPEYGVINPTNTVPTLVNDQHKSINQSLAIIEYLEETCPQPSLLPQFALDRAYVRSLALSIACEIHPLNNLKVLNYLSKEMQLSSLERDQWYQHWINQGLNSLEIMIKTSAFYQNNFCYMNMITIADLFLIPQLYNARRFNCELNHFPTLQAIENKCLELKIFTEAIPYE